MGWSCFAKFVIKFMPNLSVIVKNFQACWWLGGKEQSFQLLFGDPILKPFSTWIEFAFVYLYLCFIKLGLQLLVCVPCQTFQMRWFTPLLTCFKGSRSSFHLCHHNHHYLHHHHSSCDGDFKRCHEYAMGWVVTIGAGVIGGLGRIQHTIVTITQGESCWPHYHFGHPVWAFEHHQLWINK